MPKRSRKKPEPDFNQVAFQVVKKATEQPIEPSPDQNDISKVMRLMGRKGGLIGGKRRLETMTPEERRQAAFQAAKARWARTKKKKR